MSRPERPVTASKVSKFIREAHKNMPYGSVPYKILESAMTPRQSFRDMQSDDSKSPSPVINTRKTAEETYATPRKLAPRGPDQDRLLPVKPAHFGDTASFKRGSHKSLASCRQEIAAVPQLPLQKETLKAVIEPTRPKTANPKGEDVSFSSAWFVREKPDIRGLSRDQSISVLNAKTGRVRRSSSIFREYDAGPVSCKVVSAKARTVSFLPGC